MTDDETFQTETDEDFPPEGASEDTNRLSLMTVLAVITVIVVIVLALLMLRGCGSVLNSANRSGGSNEIVPVEHGTPLDGSISVWAKAGTDLNQALSSAGVTSLGILDTGGGRFVVSVPTGTEAQAARSLRDVDGIYDAGRVYSQEATAKP